MTQYGYDDNSNLVSVTWPDGNVRRYVYGDARFKNAITGEVDETGTRIATWNYGAQGRASAVSHSDATRNVQFAYSSGQTTIADSQRTTAVKFASVAGMLRPTGARSPSRTTSTSWDVLGNVLSETNPTAGTNEFSYDATGRAVRLVIRNASSTTITSVRYADTTGLGPSTIASPGKVRAFVYDVKGNLTGFSELATDDPTGQSAFDGKASGQQRTVGIGYNSSNCVVTALEYFNGKKISDWLYVYDETGNLRVANDSKPAADKFPTVYEDKILDTMKGCGWTKEDIELTIANPYRTAPARDTRRNNDGGATRPDDPATAYIREDGHYVVRNDVDGTLVQISKRSDPNWKSPF